MGGSDYGADELAHRAKPITRKDAAGRLTADAQCTFDEAMAGLQRFLVAARDIKTPQGPPPFAFKLHQFISDEAAFYNLLSLLDPAFLGLQSRASADDPLRQQLARHLVQRRRKDIVEWQTETQDGRGFARRIKTVLTYKLTGDWGAFF